MEWLDFCLMDSVSNFGFARWLFCFGRSGPLGVAGLLSRPSLGTPKCTILGKLITHTHNWEFLWISLSLSVDKGQSKGQHVWPRNLCEHGELRKNHFSSYKDWLACTVPAGLHRAHILLCIEPLHLLALRGLSAFHYNPYCQGFRIQP